MKKTHVIGIPLTLFFHKLCFGDFYDNAATGVEYSHFPEVYKMGVYLCNEKYLPESKRVAREGITSAARLDFSKPHAPLLITSGDKDNLLPASLNYRNFKRYPQGNGSVTEYKEFPGRNHFVLGQSTWREDADYILQWLART